MSFGPTEQTLVLAYALLKLTSVTLGSALRFSLKEILKMLWTILVILLVLWLLGFIGHVGGNLIHLLLLVALVILIINLVSGRRGPVV
ncbi:MAG TPA: lmo0937 family membrane protein [Pyrinomonadaceae bacterium]|nr:lmo0937 family membrane protein [Pyrinomonadaceae bacterium]